MTSENKLLSVYPDILTYYGDYPNPGTKALEV